jgi:hypothetical protein
MIRMNFNGAIKNDNIYRLSRPIQMIAPKQTSLNTIQINIENQAESTVPKKKIEWGEPIWFLFHTLAHKVKDAAFLKVKTELLNIIFLICTNLPCPDCANHATRYLQGINFDAISTKDQLKDMLFNFHNSVNMKKGVSVFPRDQLDTKYDAAITVNIVNNFYHNFDKSSNIQKMAANGFHRTRTIQKMKGWIANNANCFNP